MASSSYTVWRSLCRLFLPTAPNPAAAANLQVLDGACLDRVKLRLLLATKHGNSYSLQVCRARDSNAAQLLSNLLPRYGTVSTVFMRPRRLRPRRSCLVATLICRWPLRPEKSRQFSLLSLLRKETNRPLSYEIIGLKLSRDGRTAQANPNAVLTSKVFCC